MVIISINKDKDLGKGRARGASLVLGKPAGIDDLRSAIVHVKTDKTLDL